MGSVWRAVRADGRFDGYVAIKFVHAAWLGREGERRFRQEGVVLARLDHPHIARLIDAGALDPTRPYLVLEFVEGVPIDEYCERHELALDARLRLFLSVLAAVAHAHSHLIVHRDIKPSNILVTDAGVTKLLDFGIAKLLRSGSEDAALTRGTSAALTPDYAAPEQLLGDEVTIATDVYSLGLVLYRLLTGTHPVARESRSSAEFARALLDEEPAPASAVAIGPPARRRALAGDLDNILAKALKKAPAERYPSVGAFADDLERYLTHQPVLARPDTVGYRAAKFVRRHSGTVAGGALVAIGLVGTSAFAVLQMLDARAQRDLAQFEARHTSAQSELLEFLLGEGLSQLPDDAVRQRLVRARDMVRARFRTEPLIAARLLIGLSGRSIDAGDATLGAELLQEAGTIGRALDDPALNAEIACGRAQDLVDAGDLAAARTSVVDALANLQRLKAVPLGLEAECAIARAFVAQGGGDYASSSHVLREAAQSLERAGLERTSRYTSVAHELGRSLALAGDYRGAWAMQQKLLAVLADVGRTNTAGYYAMVNIGVRALRGGGKPGQALELLQSVMTAARRAAPQAELPFYLEASKALAQLEVGQAAATAPRLNDLAQTAQKAGQPALVAILRTAAIRAAIERGEIESAEAGWEQVAPRFAKLLQEDRSGREAVMLGLVRARLDLAEQRPQDAARRLEEAAASIAERRQPSDPERREIELLQAQVALTHHDEAAAAQHARWALERAQSEAVDPQSSAWVGEALVWRARIETARGAAVDASATARAALPHLEQNLDPAHPLLQAARDIAGRGT
jgi:serine/threonine-protein kinase